MEAVNGEEQSNGAAPLSDDVAVWIRNEKFVDTIDEERIKVPRVSFRTDTAVVSALKGVLLNIMESGALRAQSDGEATILLGKALLEAGPQVLLESAVAILGNPEKYSADWVLDHMDAEGVLDLVVPFLLWRRERIVKKLTPVAQRYSQLLQ